MNHDPCVTCPNRDKGFCGLGIAEREFRTVRRGHLISAQTQPAQEVLVLCAGWAADFRNLSNTRRQILDFLLPGDLLTPATVVENCAECSVLALTDVQFSVSSRSDIVAKLQQNARLQSTVSSSIAEKLNEARQLLTAVARGSAEQRIAFLILHLAGRLGRQSVVRGERYVFPLLQQHIADALGLTAVHVSRVMAAFRTRGWMNLSDGILEISNRPELERLGLL